MRGSRPPGRGVSADSPRLRDRPTLDDRRRSRRAVRERRRSRSRRGMRARPGQREAQSPDDSGTLARPPSSAERSTCEPTGSALGESAVKTSRRRRRCARRCSRRTPSAYGWCRVGHAVDHDGHGRRHTPRPSVELEPGCGSSPVGSAQVGEERKLSGIAPREASRWTLPWRWLPGRPRKRGRCRVSGVVCFLHRRRRRRAPGRRADPAPRRESRGRRCRERRAARRGPGIAARVRHAAKDRHRCRASRGRAGENLHDECASGGASHGAVPLRAARAANDIA